LLGAVIAIALFNQTQFSLTSLDFLLSLQLFSKGETEIKVLPLGTVSAPTHLFPVKIILVLNNINFKILEEMIAKGFGQQQLFDNLSVELILFLKLYLIKIFILSVLGATIATFLYSGNLKSSLKSSIIGLCLASTIIGGIYSGYDYKKFYNPEYYGALENAPWMLELLQDGLEKMEKLGEKIETVAQNVDVLYRNFEQSVAFNQGDEYTQILHVSDIHNNPIAFRFIEQIVESFGVDIIVDTGDLTDFGTPLETFFLEKIESLEIPYLFVAGNHDSPQVINALSGVNNVINVNKKIVNVKGIDFIGINDPASVSNKVIPPAQEEINEYAAQLNELMNSSQRTPDIMLIHNPQLANQFTGRLPTVLFGHSHQHAIEIDKGTVLVNAGTTGAAGIRGLGTTQEVSYTLVLLSFQQQQFDTVEVKWQLVATDTIKIFNSKPGFVVEHQVYTK